MEELMCKCSHGNTTPYLFKYLLAHANSPALRYGGGGGGEGGKFKKKNFIIKLEGSHSSSISPSPPQGTQLQETCQSNK